MITFVTGGTGALGAPTVDLLRRHGHRVRVLATGAASADRLRAAGAEPVLGSLFDEQFLASAVRGADAMLHLATRIVPIGKARRRAAWHDNDRIRRVGTRNLVTAALGTGVSVVVYPSFAPIYADGGARWLSYGDPVAPTDILQSTLEAEGEVDRFTAAGGRGVVLRMAASTARTRPRPATCWPWQAGGSAASWGRPRRTSRWSGTRTPPRRWSPPSSPVASSAGTTSPTTGR